MKRPVLLVKEQENSAFEFHESGNTKELSRVFASKDLPVKVRILAAKSLVRLGAFELLGNLLTTHYTLYDATSANNRRVAKFARNLLIAKIIRDRQGVVKRYPRLN
jgi:hypothetical protein